MGFTAENYGAFTKCDTTRKLKLGGKGVGRLVWLKAFQKATIKSTFRENGAFRLRNFDFVLSDDPIRNTKIEDANAEAHETEIRLIGLMPDYRVRLPVRFDTIAHKIVEHLLQFFVLDNCPRFTLHDEYERSECNLNRLFKRDVRIEQKTVTFSVDSHPFKLRHVRLDSSVESRHQLHFCANDRAVQAEDASPFIPDLHGLLVDGSTGKQFVYAGYVSGILLDQSVLQDRTGFTIPLERTLIKGEKETSWESLVRRCRESSRLSF